MTLTQLERTALEVLFESASGNGHDFGFIDDLVDARVMGRNQVSGVVASLVKKGLIMHWGEENCNWGNSYTQFTWEIETAEGDHYWDTLEQLLAAIEQKEAA